MFSVNIRCVQYNATKLDKKILFTLGKLRNYASLTAAVHNNHHHHSSSLRRANRSNTIEKQQLSRYSASTIMPHFKEFRINDYDIIGFDLDGTLLRYNLNNMVPLEYELLTKFLVEKKNYPRALLDKKFNVNFVQKGLIIDALRGNIMKLNGDGSIIKATHGTRFLSDQEIKDIYGEDRKWNVAQEYIKDPLSAWNGPIAEKLRTLLDYFDIASSLVFAHAVDVLDETNNNNDRQDYQIWPDMLSGLIQIYTREHFATGESDYFEAIKGNPDKYLLKTDEKVINHLRELRASGKALYLLTGSNIDFASFTAAYALGPQWRDLFNCIISFAKKPGFFYMQRQFLQIKNLEEIPNSEISLTDEMTANSCYSQGNWQQLKESLSKQVLRKDPNQVRCVYVGDNLIQDVFAPNTVANMDTVAISEELMENDNNFEYKSIIQSPLWGSYFSNDGTPTLWSTIIANYSQLCVSHMNVMAKVPIKEKIHCENKDGYFPKIPEGLLIR